MEAAFIKGWLDKLGNAKYYWVKKKYKKIIYIKQIIVIVIIFVLQRS